MTGQLRAAAVHAFTASGAVCALMATLAVFAGPPRWTDVFLWLGVALLIDGIDGIFARLVDVKTRLPRFSGERLDLVIDYVTYVFIPALALWQAGFLGGGLLGLGLAAAILLSSLYHFSDTGSKADDHSFVGFPAIWNIVAFYLFAFDAPFALAALAILAFSALTFVPWRWVHPLRVTALRPLTLALTAAWSAAAIWTLWQGFPAGTVAKVILVAVGLYGIGLALVWRQAPRAV